MIVTKEFEIHVIVNTISRNVSVLLKFLVLNEFFLSNLHVEIFVFIYLLFE